MTFDARRTRRLQHVTATGTALAVALGPLVVGALFAKSVGGDPMVSVNALIAGGGQRARISRAQLRTGARLRPVARLRTEARLRTGARLGAGARLGIGDRLRAGDRLRPVARFRSSARPQSRGSVVRPRSGARLARQEEALRRLLPDVRLPYQPGRLDEPRRRQQGRQSVG